MPPAPAATPTHNDHRLLDGILCGRIKTLAHREGRGLGHARHQGYSGGGAYSTAQHHLQHSAAMNCCHWFPPTERSPNILRFSVGGGEVHSEGNAKPRRATMTLCRNYPRPFIARLSRFRHDIVAPRQERNVLGSAYSSRSSHPGAGQNVGSRQTQCYRYIRLTVC
jgi:hypothetical protein